MYVETVAEFKNNMPRRLSLWVIVICLIITLLLLDLSFNKSLIYREQSDSDQLEHGSNWAYGAFKDLLWNFHQTTSDSQKNHKSSHLTQMVYPYLIKLGPGLTPQEVADFNTVMSQTDYNNNKTAYKNMPDVLHLMVLGDWGGATWYPYTSEIQLAVARAMEEVASTTKVHGVLSVGDNFYEEGVSDLEDPHFNATFEQVYRGHLLHTPWFTQSGNHDYVGNMSAQIAYTKVSDRWKFPSYNYQVSWNLTNSHGRGKLTVVMVDTIMLCGNCGLDYPLDPPHGPSDPQLAEETWAWFENTLKEASNVDHLVVVGHFPVLSVGMHGPTECLTNRMLSMLYKYRVSVYLTGHDHNMQHILAPSRQYNWDLNHYVVGTGAKVEPIIWHMKDIPSDQLLFYNGETYLEKGAGGFALMELDAACMNFTFYNSNSKPLHRHSIQSRKTSKTKSTS